MEEEDKKSNRKLIFGFVIIVLLISGLAAGGMYYWQKKQNNKKIDNIQSELDQLKLKESTQQKKSVSEKPTTFNQQTTTASKEVVPPYATDWYKFISPNYGFTFRYPKSTTPAVFTGAVTTCKNPLTVSDLTKDMFGVDAFWVYGEFFGAGIKKYSGTIDQFIAESDSDKIRNYSHIKVTGAKDAIKFSQTMNKQVDGYPPFAYTGYILQDNKNIYTINGFQNNGFSGDCVPNNLPDTQEQIIGTFNFYN